MVKLYYCVKEAGDQDEDAEDALNLHFPLHRHCEKHPKYQIFSKILEQMNFGIGNTTQCRVSAAAILPTHRDNGDQLTPIHGYWN